MTVAGCGAQGSPVSGASPSREAPTLSAAPATPSKPVVRPPGLRGSLLTAKQLPGLNKRLDGGLAWRATGTRTEGSDAFGVCQKTPLVTIGATRALVRSYEPTSTSEAAGGAAASQVVAKFADPKSAWRTFEALKSWREQCADLMDFDDEEVSDLVDVPVPTGDAHRFLVSYAPDAGTDPQLVAYGLTRVDRYVSLVQFTLTSQDWNHPAGREPESVAIGTINRLLEKLD